MDPAVGAALYSAPPRLCPALSQQITRYVYWTSAGTAVILAWLLERIAQQAENYRPQSGQWVLAGVTAILFLSSYYTGQKQ